MAFDANSIADIFGRADDNCPTAQPDFCPSAAPACPACPTGQHCELASQNCNECPKTYCAADAVKTVAHKSSGPNVGAIAGGVVGGVVGIAVLVYLIWRFCVKNKRKEYEAEYVDQYSDEDAQAEKDFNARRDARASTHTVQSIASSVMTRASNIIQIAYIPGVTNRSAPSTPGLLVPPVPPIPIALSNSSINTYEDQHFFMPGDLRDSTYSAMTDRVSYAPTRASVASTIYGKNAVVPMPAQTVMRGKAAVISVASKSNANSTLGGDATPPVPSINIKFKERDDLEPPPSPAFSVGSTFLNSASASTATQVRPTVVKVSSFTKSVKSKASEATLLKSPAVTLIDDSPAPEQGPFGDPPTRAAGHTKKASLGKVVEEAARRASQDVTGGLGKREGGESPFDDKNSVKE